jgi:hypothetical protein
MQQHTHGAAPRRAAVGRSRGRIALLALAAMLALSCAAPTLAGAYSGPVWRVGTVPVTVSKQIEWREGTFNWLDESPFGQIENKCATSGTGFVSPEGKGEITKWTLSGCVSIKGCESELALEAVHLPWRTQLIYVEGLVRDKFESSGAGTPGFKYSCKLLGTKWKNETVSIPAQSVTNLAGKVEENFVKEKVSCAEFGTKQCEITGREVPAVTSGGELSVK